MHGSVNIVFDWVLKTNKSLLKYRWKGIKQDIGVNMVTLPKVTVEGA